MHYHFIKVNYEKDWVSCNAEFPILQKFLTENIWFQYSVVLFPFALNPTFISLHTAVQ